MSGLNEGFPVVTDYAFDLDYPPGWINLALDHGSREAADKLAREEVEKFNPLMLRVEKGSLTREIARLALQAEKDDHPMAAAYYTDEGACLAEFQGGVFGEDGVRPTPADIQPMLLEKADAKVAGAPDVTYLDHPLGPAVRVQATFKTKGVFGFGRSLFELVSYAVCPTVIDDVAVATISWESLAHTEELTKLADELIQKLTLAVFDEHGDEIDPGLLR